METKQDIIRHERAALRQKYGSLFDSIAAILFEADPMRINFGTNADEYEPETGTILSRLPQASTIENVENIVHEEFCSWFGVDIVRTRENYQTMVAAIWREWCKWQDNSRSK